MRALRTYVYMQVTAFHLQVNDCCYQCSAYLFSHNLAHGDEHIKELLLFVVLFHFSMNSLIDRQCFLLGATGWIANLII